MDKDHNYHSDIACKTTEEPLNTEDGIKLSEDAIKVNKFQRYNYMPETNGRLTDGDD